MCDDPDEFEDVVMIEGRHDLHLALEVLTNLIGYILLQHLDGHQVLRVCFRAQQVSCGQPGTRHRANRLTVTVCHRANRLTVTTVTGLTG